MEMTAVSGNEAFVIFDMTPDNIHTFWRRFGSTTQMWHWTLFKGHLYCVDLIVASATYLCILAGKKNGDTATATAAFGQEQWQLYLWSQGLCWGARKEDYVSGAVSHSQLDSFSSIWYPRWKWIHSPWTSKEAQEVAPQKKPNFSCGVLRGSRCFFPLCISIFAVFELKI